MNRLLSLALFGAISFTGARGTDNPVILEKLQNIIKNTNDESVKLINLSTTNAELDPTQQNDLNLPGTKGFTGDVHHEVKKEQEEANKQPPNIEKETAEIEKAIEDLKQDIKEEIDQAQKSYDTTAQTLKDQEDLVTTIETKYKTMTEQFQANYESELKYDKDGLAKIEAQYEKEQDPTEKAKLEKQIKEYKEASAASQAKYDKHMADQKTKYENGIKYPKKLVAALKVIVEAKKAMLDRVKSQENGLKDLEKLKEAIKANNQKEHDKSRAVFFRDEAKTKLEEAKLELTINQAEQAYLELKQKDPKATEENVDLLKKELVSTKERETELNKDITELEGKLKKWQSEVRKLKQTVRMVAIWIVVALLIVGCLAYGWYFIACKDESDYGKLYPTAVEAKEGGEDDQYHRFIDSELTQ